MIAEVTKGTVLQRRPVRLTDSQATALHHLVTLGTAMRVRRGWCFNSFAGPFVAPGTMGALVRRGFATTRFSSAGATGAGRAAHAELIEVRS
ncbi:MAG TPA: hypothetical protein VIQ29_04435 [Ancylobacter sp.]